MNADDLAKRRFFTLQAVRLGGLVLLLLGILMLNQAIRAPAVVGYGLIVLGVIGFGVLPVVLSRRWRTRRP